MRALWWGARVTIILLFVFALYLVWLDSRIQDEFSGQRWQLPARVFARPEELYPGRSLGPAQLVRRLVDTGYREVQGVPGEGEYRRLAGALELVTRPFGYWDGSQARARVRIAFEQGRIGRMSADGAPVSLMRLEPPLIGKFYPDQDEDRVLVSRSEVPDDLIHALLSAEDRHYFEHGGLDPRGIARALWVDLRSGELSQGGSTITQQLVKNFFLTRHRTLARKINEALMAILLERRYSKDEILLAYINEIYLGQSGRQGIHGFGTAAEFYFGRPLRELRVDQLALLAGLVRGASFYNPRTHPERARERRNLVLRLMEENGYLDAAQVAQASARPLHVRARPTWSSARFPDFLDFSRRQLLRDYRLPELKNEGLRIFSTLDPAVQERIQASIDQTVRSLEQERGLARGTLQAAAVVVNISDGQVLGLAGSRGADPGGFNRALDARRPVGSLVKPFIYLTALSRPERYNLLSRLDDSELRVKQPDGGIWAPLNYDRRFHGSVTLFDALINSYNVATVRLGLDVGLDAVAATLHAAGMNSLPRMYPATLLGALELSPLEVSQLYQTLANDGFRVPLNGISAVLDSSGAALKRYDLELSGSLDPRAAFLTKFLLTHVIGEGTARAAASRLHDRLPLAGKTGTTNDLRDSWFAGFGDNLLTVVWLGRDDNAPAGFTGASGALRIWTAIMAGLDVIPVSATAPEGVRWLQGVHIHVRGDCVSVPSLPYAGTAPVAADACPAASWLH